MVRIAVDAMGGDHAPLEIIRGVEAACAEGAGEVVLVGDEKIIAPLLKRKSGIEILHTPVTVEMKESPSTALRRKKDSSMNKAFSLVKSGDAQAVVTAGNSGAAMAFAIFTLGRIPGIERPAILTVLPNGVGALTILVDAGGNVDCKVSHLVQFACMANVFAKCAMGIDSPRIGLLSNGEEETKGNELTRETHSILKNVGLNYIGYIEGTDIFNGVAHVAVADGFVGNVVLKVSEGVGEAVVTLLKTGILKSFRARLGYRFFMSDVFKSLMRSMDYAEYGGAPLVGVDGVSVICHGKSKAKAIKNAILRSKSFVERNLNEHMKSAVEDYSISIRTKEQ